MRIAYLTDGNSELGLGHVYQSKTLAGYLLQKGGANVEIMFVTQSAPEIVDLITKDGFNAVRVQNDEAVLTYLKSYCPNVIIFDKLDIEPSFAKVLKEQIQAKLCIFTCITDANDYADLSVLADMGSNFKNICDRKNGQTIMRGTKYWIMRPDFYKYAKESKESVDTIRKITLIFGGADPQNYSEKVVEQLLKNNTFEINLIIGSAYPHEEELENKITKCNSKSHVKLMKNVTNVAELMFNSDLVFSSPGLSMFEALKVNTPVISFWQSELQRDVYGDYIKTYSPKDVDKVLNLIYQKDFIYPDDDFIKGLEIGCGLDDIIHEIFN